MAQQFFKKTSLPFNPRASITPPVDPRDNNPNYKKVYQRMIGTAIPTGVYWSPYTGPSSPIKIRGCLVIGQALDQFHHLMIMGLTASGKGVFAATFGLYMHDNFNFKFIDFNDPDGNYENGYYGWPNETPFMLDRFKDTFTLNEPHGYPFELLYPTGTLEEVPEFFTPFKINYQDLSPFDFNMFFQRGTAEDDADFTAAFSQAKTLEKFMSCIFRYCKPAYPIMEYLFGRGILTDETTLDYERLANPDIIHAFSMASIGDKRARTFLTNVVVRLIYESRFGRDYSKCIFYVREAGTLDDVSSKLIATRGRHSGVSFVIDTQRRVSMIDKTAAMQFSSQALFRMTQEQAKEALDAAGLNKDLAPMLARANPGVCILNVVGNTMPVYPVAVSPPVSAYKQPGTDYFKHCHNKGVKFKKDPDFAGKVW